MKKLFQVVLAFCVTISAVVVSTAQQKEEPKLIQFQMAILRKGPRWTQQGTDDARKTLQQHWEYVKGLLGSGKAAIAGPTEDAALAGIYILRTPSAEEAKALVDNDPAVKAGLFTAEMHPWWSEDIFKQANSPLKMETVYLGFLKRGPNRKEGDGRTPEVQELQKAHIANINRLAATKKLVVAGPFGDGGDLRGIFVFRVASLNEAKELSATDPMIKIDRLRLDLYPWRVPTGVIP